MMLKHVYNKRNVSVSQPKRKICHWFYPEHIRVFLAVVANKRKNKLLKIENLQEKNESTAHNNGVCKSNASIKIDFCECCITKEKQIL